MKKLIPVVTVLLVFFLAACATPPTDDMNKAHDAVTRAENDPDAVTYAANTLVRARDSLNRMQGEADAKRYDSAKNLANEAVNYAERAIADGRAGATRAREDAANLLNSLQTPLAETANSLETARQNNMKLDYDELSGDLASANRTYNEGRQSLQANNFPDATAKAHTVRNQLSDINAKITDAVIEVARKK